MFFFLTFYNMWMTNAAATLKQYFSNSSSYSILMAFLDHVWTKLFICTCRPRMTRRRDMTELSRTEVEEASSRLTVWPFAFAPPRCWWPQTRAEGRRGAHVSSRLGNAPQCMTSPRGGGGARMQKTGQRLALTWTSPLTVGTRVERGRVCSLQTAGYSSKRDTVHTPAAH